jgi:lysophospholipase L1-like esterase
MSGHSRLIHRVAIVGAAVLAAGAIALPAVSASASPSPGWPPRGQAPVVAGSDYLALGDSVTFGYRESTTTPAPDYADQADFVGYPEDVASALGLSVANLSCPGETSSSLISQSAQSNGCENAVVAGQTVDEGYRTLYPLHVEYKGSQLQAAVAYLQSHRNTRLVSLMIGANDAFVCEALTADDCTSTSELAGVIATIEKNVATMLGAIRRHYSGQIVIVSYYSLDYANATDVQQSELLDNALDSAAAPYHVELASGYSAFESASQDSANDPCTAGLLTQLSAGGCGIHPTPAGQDVLAQAVESAITK